MTAKLLTKPWEHNALRPVAVCGGIHIVADVVLINQAWVLSDELLVAALSLPLSQCSLCALWAATSRVSPYVRFAAPFLGAVACWFLLSQILPWGIGDPLSAGWAVALAVQTLAIVTTIHLYRLARNLAARRGADASRANPTNDFAFDLRTLMLWTTVIAFGFGFVQFGRVEWRWTAAIASWDYLEAMPMMGVFNALLGLLWLWALARGSRQWRTAKTIIVVLLIGSASYALPSILAWICGSAVIGVHYWLILATAQSLYIVTSFAVVLIATRNGGCAS